MRMPLVGQVLFGSLVALALAVPASAAPFTVTIDNNVNNLLTALLGTTTGLSAISGTLTGDPVASGRFTDDPFGLGSGVVLSTGNVTTVVGPNNSPSAGVDLGPSGTTGDTTTLTVNFTSDATVNHLFFNYVFGSEEFFEFIGSTFNDFFTLKLDGTNFAKLVCGQDVTINNFAIPACAAELTNNAGGTITQLDAYTHTLLFSAPLTAGAHSLQLSIGDVGDGGFDSAVFIKGNSIGTADPTVPEPASMFLLGSGLCYVARRRARRA
jgi:hypothetical protein